MLVGVLVLPLINMGFRRNCCEVLTFYRTSLQLYFENIICSSVCYQPLRDVLWNECPFNSDVILRNNKTNQLIIPYLKKWIIQDVRHLTSNAYQPLQSYKLEINKTFLGFSNQSLSYHRWCLAKKVFLKFSLNSQ